MPHQVATSTVLPAGGCFSGGLIASCRVELYSSTSSSQLTPLLPERKDHQEAEVTHCRGASWLLWPASHQASASPLRSRGTPVIPSARACSTPHLSRSCSSIDNCSQDRLHGGVERGLRRLISPNRATRPWPPIRSLRFSARRAIVVSAVASRVSIACCSGVFGV